jgi:hypothetical protein
MVAQNIARIVAMVSARAVGRRGWYRKASTMDAQLDRAVPSFRPSSR